MTGYEYEKKCAELLKAKGFTNVTVTPGSGDQGIDVLAKKGKKKYGIQCKYYEGTVGNKAVQEAFAGASFYDCTVAMVITNSKLTEPAKKLAAKLGVEVWEGIDAIYLRKNDAEYQKKEKERKALAALKRKQQMEEKQQRKEAEKQQQKQEFQAWQTAYKATLEMQEQDMRTAIEQAEAEYEERKRKLTAQCEKDCNDISAHISKLRSEREKTCAELADTSLFQFSHKKQLKQRVVEIDAQITQQSENLNDKKCAGLILEQEYQLKLSEQKTVLKAAAEEKYPFPQFPQSLNHVKDSCLRDKVWEQANTLVQRNNSVRLNDEDLKYMILLQLWEKGGADQISFGDTYCSLFEDTFEARFIERLLAELEYEGKIKKVKLVKKLNFLYGGMGNGITTKVICVHTF